MDCKVSLTVDQNSRFVKVLRAREPVPESPGLDKDEKEIPAPSPRTDAQLIQDNLFNHISGAVLYKEKQDAQSSVKEF